MNLKSLAAAVFLAAPTCLFGATAPYSNDFSGTGSNTAFTYAPSSSASPTMYYSVTSGVNRLTYTNSSAVGAATSLSLTNMGTQNFSFTTQVSISSFGTQNTNGTSVGFGLFGLDNAFTGSLTSNAYYLVDWNVANSGGTTGTLRILALGDTTGFTATNGAADVDPSAGLAAVLNTVYTMKVTGTYTGSTLNMTMKLYDSTGTTQIGTTATASDTTPLTGTNFGYRSRAGIGGGTFTANYDNFAVAVPEPASLSILAGAGLLAMRRRRR